MAKHIVATVDEIPPGNRKLVELSGRLIGVFNINGEYFALRSRCPHQGGPLCEGKLSGLVQSDKPGRYDYSRPAEILRCPWHGWEFDIRTGQSWVDPAKTWVRHYPVTLETGSEFEAAGEAGPSGWVKGPYMAETYPVSVEQQYVVVQLT
jgi:3-phenylpropionate/trans-cinnamate dioxygenase ferredoxin subunit